MARGWLRLMILFFAFVSHNGARLFGAPANVLTGFQVTGADNQVLLKQYRLREVEYNITVDVYSFYINCGMHRGDGHLKDYDKRALTAAASAGRHIHLMFECPKWHKSQWDEMRFWNDLVETKWQNYFSDLFDAADGKIIFFRPFQEFTNPVTGYPWVIEQGWNTPISGCYLHNKVFKWSTCHSGYFSKPEDIQSNRAQFNGIVRHLRGAALAVSRGRPFQFVIAGDGNTLFDDTKARPKIAVDLAAAAEGAGDIIGLDAYSGQKGKKRDFHSIFVEGYNDMLSADPALKKYAAAIPELGVAQDQVDREGQICTAMQMPNLRMVIYWDSHGSGGNYKLDTQLANAHCWPQASKVGRTLPLETIVF